MRIRSNLRRTKGFVVAWERLIRFRYMISEKAKQRVRILAFWEKYGDEATKEAFKVSRPTLYRWQKALAEGNGKLESLNAQSTAPKGRRRRVIPESVSTFIIREREFDPHLGKEKLATLMKNDGIAALSASTVGRMLTDLKKQGVLANPKQLSFDGRTGTHREKIVQKRTKLRSKGHTGDLVKADSIVRFHNGMRLFKTVAPVSLTHIQTDNGSEFQKHFDIYLEQQGIVHFHTYPRCPKQNAEIERFNRTLSDAFIKQYRHVLAYDIDAFNEKLMDWLLWYNTRRPHWSLGLKSPLRYYCDRLTTDESRMCWTSTLF